MLFLTGLIFTSVQLSLAFQGVFWDICDLHLNVSYQPEINGGFGDYKKDSPLSLIKSAFQKMKDHYPTPHFILINGDNVYHGDNDFIENISNVSHELILQFPNTTILPTLGNHDVNPRNEMGEGSKWCETFFEIWKAAFDTTNTSEIEMFKKGCFYSSSIKSEHGTIIVIVLNTLLWYDRNNISETGDPYNQFLWLEQKLQFARNLQNKVFLVGHVPPGSSEYSSYIIKHLHPEFNKKLLKLMQHYSDTIESGFFAHQHTDAFKIVLDENDKPVIPLFQSPSVTPFYLKKMGSVNPSIRLYCWNNTSAGSKYYQFHTHLMNTSSLNWTLEYVSDSILKDLSANSLNNLLTDMEKRDSVYFDSFFAHHLSGHPHDNKTCSVDSFCRCQFICAMKNIDYTKLDLCLNTCSSKSSNLWILILCITLGSIIILAVAVILLYIFYFRKKFPRETVSNEELCDF